LEEGRRRAEDALRKGAAAADDLTLAKALYCLGGLSFLQGEYETAENRLRESVGLWRTPPEHRRGLGFALIVLGMTLLQREETKHAEARAFEEEGVRIFRESGDDWGLALALSDLGNIEKVAGRHAEAQKCYEESLARWESVKDSWGSSLALSYLGDLAYRRGEYPAARRNMRAALGIQRARGDKWGMAWSLNMLGRIGASTPDYEQAATHFRESLSLHAELGRKHMIAYCLEGLAGVAGAEGEWRRAVVLIGAAKALRQSIEAPMTAAEEAEQEQRLAQIRERLGAATVEDALAQGGKMSLELESIVSYAKAGCS
jgi:tetratricopeptide (TPR) repeat protein